MPHYQYTKKLNPYLKTAHELKELVDKAHPMMGSHFWQIVIPVKGQNWLGVGSRSIEHFLPGKDGAFALRVGHGDDPYAGHVGMAFSPFACGDVVELVDRKNTDNTLRIRIGYVLPVKNDQDGLWYYRVEYQLEA